jgi:hypothetical protein
MAEKVTASSDKMLGPNTPVSGHRSEWRCPGPNTNSVHYRRYSEPLMKNGRSISRHMMLVFVERRRHDGKGRPWRDARTVLNGVLWILRTGAQWQDLPRRYPPYQTCHRRFQQWQRDGRFEVILQTLAEDLVDRGGLDLSEGSIDVSFSGAKKGLWSW